MPDSELYKRIWNIEFKNQPSWFSRTHLLEIKNNVTGQCPIESMEDKVIQGSAFSWLLMSIPVVLILGNLIFLPENWKLLCLLLVVWLLITCVAKILDDLFGKHEIEITGKGLRIEEDLYSWEAIEGVFILEKHIKSTKYELIIATNGGQFRRYNLDAYLRKGISRLREELNWHIAPRLPLVK